MRRNIEDGCRIGNPAVICLAFLFILPGLSAVQTNKHLLYGQDSTESGMQIGDALPVSAAVYHRDSLIALPGITTTSDLFSLESGAVVVGEQPDLPYFVYGMYDLRQHDQSLSSVHLRGADANRVQYLVEGSPVGHPIYGGRNPFDLNLGSLESVEIMKGVPSARYGEMLSGVVNMKMREAAAGRPFELELNYRQGSDKFGYDSFNRNYMTFFAGGSVPAVEGLSAAVSGGFDLSETPYHMNKPREDFSLFGIDVKDRQESRSHLNVTTTYRLTSRQSLRLLYNGYWSQWNEYSYPWVRHPENTADYRRDNEHLNLNYRHQFSDETRFEFSYSYLTSRYGASVDGRTPLDYWINTGTDTMRSIIEDPKVNRSTAFLDSNAVEDIWHDEKTSVNTFEIRIESAELPRQHLEAGVSYRLFDLEFTDIIGGATSLTDYGIEELYDADFGEISLPPPAGPYKFFGEHRSSFKAQPTKSAAYIQDRIDLEDVILELGVRVDRFDRGSRINREDYRQVWTRATGLRIGGLNGSNTFERVSYAISPRATIRFPIDQSSFYFAYGQFSQMPEMQKLYRDPYSLGYIGNPALGYMKTELAEAGWNPRVAPGLKMSVNGYLKNIRNLPGPMHLLADFGRPVLIYTNGNMNRIVDEEFKSRVWGGEAGFSWTPNRHLQLSGNHTIQWARGYVSDLDWLIYMQVRDQLVGTFPNVQVVRQDRPLDWDVRHRTVLRGSLHSPAGRPLTPFGLQLPGDWKLSLIWRFDSGRPYTPHATNPAEVSRQWNSGTTDYRMRTDLKFTKGLNWGGLRAEFFVESFNLYNQYNVNPDFGFNKRTGKPWSVGQKGQLPPDEDRLSTFQDVLMMLDPRRYQPGFHMQVGVKLGM